MKVILLGAGAPAHGTRPAALKQIAISKKALDWQLDCFSVVATEEEIHLMGT